MMVKLVGISEGGGGGRRLEMVIASDAGEGERRNLVIRIRKVLRRKSTRD